MISRRTFLKSGVVGIGSAGIASTSPPVRAQTDPTVKWETTVGDDSTTIFNDGVRVDDGRYLLVGQREHPENGVLAPWGAVLDSEGNVEFTSDRPAPPHQGALYDIVPKGDGTVYVIGQDGKESGSYPALSRVEPTADGIQTMWTESAPRPGFGTAGVLSPDGGAVVVGTEEAESGDVNEGAIVKYNADGSSEFGKSVSTDGDAVIYDVVQTGEHGYVFVGSSTPDDGSPRALIGKLAGGDTEPAVETFTPTEQWDGARLETLTHIPNGDPPFVAGGRAIGGSQRAAYEYRFDQELTGRHEAAHALSSGLAAFREVEYVPDEQVVVAVGYRGTSTGTDGWVKVIDEAGRTVDEAAFGGDRMDTLTGLASTNPTVFVGQKGTRDGPRAWALSATGSGNTDGAGSEQASEADPTSGDVANRGFFTNDGGSPIEPLTDPFVLTVGGFFLSVVGIVHQLVGGK